MAHIYVCVRVCFDKRTLGGPRQTTNGLLRHFWDWGRRLLLQVSTSTGVPDLPGTGYAFSIHPACCFKLKIYTHTHTEAALEYFPCLQFSLTEKFDLCARTCSLDLPWACGWASVSLISLSSFLCIFIGFVQLSTLAGWLVAKILCIRRIARSQQIEFTFSQTQSAHRGRHSKRAELLVSPCSTPTPRLPLATCLSTPFLLWSLALAAHERPITRTFHAARRTFAVCIHCQGRGVGCGEGVTPSGHGSVSSWLDYHRPLHLHSADGDCICIWHVAADEVACLPASLPATSGWGILAAFDWCSWGTWTAFWWQRENVGCQGQVLGITFSQTAWIRAQQLPSLGGWHMTQACSEKWSELWIISSSMHCRDVIFGIRHTLPSFYSSIFLPEWKKQKPNLSAHITPIYLLAAVEELNYGKSQEVCTVEKWNSVCEQYIPWFISIHFTYKYPTKFLHCNTLKTLQLCSHALNKLYG